MSIEIYIMKKKMNIYIFPINHELNGKKEKKNIFIKEFILMQTKYSGYIISFLYIYIYIFFYYILKKKVLDFILVYFVNIYIYLLIKKK
ncbi:hypothetical protein LY90DRAFT_207434 [Neocallimastix californiae]|uniref:Uncharacterized protein n=1 Tax=Neocallimastix californiae TaxID=1754190 RepID=A0A1Y2EG82_9FUNG|nr:hypothetical protein LY90DRAFT_207434 [Neocallimastix californiae]|eukprot:ORY70588.1 hypothetical protein LY90DRAFT_207434 [Neocallimastix californiae]